MTTTPDHLDESADRIRVVSGHPDDDELAAVVAVVAALASRAAEADAAPAAARSAWSDPAARLRSTLRTGPDAWRRSTR